LRTTAGRPTRCCPPAGLAGGARFAYGPATAYGAFNGTIALAATTSTQGATAQLTGLQPATTYHFRLEVTTPDGTFPGGDATFTTATPAMGPVVPPIAPSVRVAPPIVSAVKQSARPWREGSALARISSSAKKKPPVGTTFSFTLDKAARVTFSFTRTLPGRKVGRACVPQTKKNDHAHRCTRTVLTALSFSAHAGTHHVRFAGRVTKSRKLSPGIYTLAITASAAGGRSKPRTIRFTIVAG
jgi:hypothetical protein